MKGVAELVAVRAEFNEKRLMVWTGAKDPKGAATVSKIFHGERAIAEGPERSEEASVAIIRGAREDLE